MTGDVNGEPRVPLPDDPDADFTEDELSLIFVSVAIAPKKVPFSEEEAEQDALQIAARLMVPFVNGDEFRAERFRQTFRNLRAELREIEKANQQEASSDGGD